LGPRSVSEFVQHLCSIFAASLQHLCSIFGRIFAASLQHLCSIFAAYLPHLWCAFWAARILAASLQHLCSIFGRIFAASLLALHVRCSIFVCIPGPWPHPIDRPAGVTPMMFISAKLATNGFEISLSTRGALASKCPKYKIPLGEGSRIR